MVNEHGCIEGRTAGTERNVFELSSFWVKPATKPVNAHPVLIEFLASGRSLRMVGGTPDEVVVMPPHRQQIVDSVFEHGVQHDRTLAVATTAVTSCARSDSAEPMTSSASPAAA